jgi:hypothetical protein
MDVLNFVHQSDFGLETLSEAISLVTNDLNLPI